MKNVRNPVVVITGAGSGLGRALALRYARRGARLLLSDLDAARAEATCAKALTKGATEAVALACDVRQESEVRKLKDTAFSRWDRVDLLINNAGVAAGGDFCDQKSDDLRWVIETNLWGVIHGCHAFIPEMKARPDGGRVLNIASAAGLLSPPKLAAYSTSKAGVIALTESLQAELNGTGVSLGVACPTFFSSGLLDQARFSDSLTAEQGRRFFSSPLAASLETVVDSCERAVDRGELYALPTIDARLMWRLKRLWPRGFGPLVSLALRHAPR